MARLEADQAKVHPARSPSINASAKARLLQLGVTDVLRVLRVYSPGDTGATDEHGTPVEEVLYVAQTGGSLKAMTAFIVGKKNVWTCDGF